jgi:hypothetical protein
MWKQDQTQDTIFTWKTLAGKNYERQSTIFAMMRELKRREYNEPSRSSVTSPLAFPCGLQDVYIWWTKLTAVKYGNKSVKHITRTVSPTGAPTRLTLRIRIISNKKKGKSSYLSQRDISIGLKQGVTLSCLGTCRPWPRWCMVHTYMRNSYT